MVWIIYFFIAMIAMSILTKFRNFKRLWVMGLTTILFLYAIDSTFIDLGAYSYKDSNSILGGIPIFYLFAGFPGGILLAYFYPTIKRFQLPYIILATAVFLIMEIIMNRLGYIKYDNWNLLKSCFLDIGSFMAILWLGQWLNATGKE